MKNATIGICLIATTIFPYYIAESSLPVTSFASGGGMDNFQKEIDERTNLTASNKFELLLFRLGRIPWSAPSCLASTSSRSAKSCPCRR
jgi:hypothetical protein